MDLRRIAFFTFMGLLMMLAIYFFVDTTPSPKPSYLEQQLKNMNERQNIAPQRLYVNAWHKIKNEYIDPSMNNQDWMKWRNRYSGQIKTMEDADVAINTMISSLNDQSSAFLYSSDYQKQKILMDLQFSGIGVGVKKENNAVIIDNVVKNSPASKQLQLGDVILEINSNKVDDVGLDNLGEIVKGKKNVKVKISRNGKIIEKKIGVQLLNILPMSYTFLKNNIAYIKINNLMGLNAKNDFINILQATNSSAGFIIDLRDNFGGILANAIDVADLMISDSLMVTIQARGNYNYKLYATKERLFAPKPIVIIINEKTASSAEILAGTLRDNLGAVLVGVQSYGKNTIQKIIPMPNMSGILLTTGKYILPNGEDINHIGLEPDLTVVNTAQKDKQFEISYQLINELINTPLEVKEKLKNKEYTPQAKRNRNGLNKVKKSNLI